MVIAEQLEVGEVATDGVVSFRRLDLDLELDAYRGPTGWVDAETLEPLASDLSRELDRAFRWHVSGHYDVS